TTPQGKAEITMPHCRRTFLKRILIVDDDDAIRESLALALEDSYQVLLARDGLEALAVLDREPGDAVLLAVMMPVLDGMGGLAAPRIIVTSAGGDAAARARALGARSFLPKPFDLDSLEAHLAEITRS